MSESDAALPYASIDPSSNPPAGPRVWAGIGIIAGGLALIVLGGCFLIGVLLQVHFSALTGASAQAAALTRPQITLMIILYTLAAICFVFAAVLLCLGVAGLLRVVRHSDD